MNDILTGDRIYGLSLSRISQVRRKIWCVWYDEIRIANNKGININLKTTHYLIFKRHFPFCPHKSFWHWMQNFCIWVWRWGCDDFGLRTKKYRLRLIDKSKKWLKKSLKYNMLAATVLFYGLFYATCNWYARWAMLVVVVANGTKS